MIDPTDPPPYEIVNGDAMTPVVLVCDHASNFMPDYVDRLGLPPCRMEEHIAWDIGAASVVRHLAARLNATAVLSGCSRLLIDCNRAPEDPAAIPLLTGGVEIPGNRSIDTAEQRRRQDVFFWPYHHAISAQIARVSALGVSPAVVAIHSFTPCLCGNQRPWQVSVLWNRDPRMAIPAMAALKAIPLLSVGENEPYSAREIGFTMDRHAGEAGLPHVSFEIRQDQLADAAGCTLWAERLDDLLRPILANSSLYHVTHY